MFLKKLSKVYHYIRCVPKTLFFNFYYLPFRQAIKFPVLVNHRTKFVELGGSIYIPSDAKSAKIKLGFGRVQISDNKYSRFIWNMGKNAEFHFGNNVKIGTGSKIHNNGIIKVGSGVNFSGEATIVCSKLISFGNECLISWQTLFMDTDLHAINTRDGLRLNPDSEIIVEERVWIGAKATVLKGTKLARHSILACNAVATNSYEQESILAGNPVRKVGDMKNKDFQH